MEKLRFRPMWLVAAILPSSMVACEREGVEFRDEQTGFEARFPGAVSTLDESLNIGEETIATRLFVHMQPMAPARQYAVSYNPLPRGINQNMTPEMRLRVGREGLLQRYPGQVIREASIKRDGVAGQEYEIATRGGRWILARLFEKADGLFVVSAYVPKTEEEQKRARRFVDSFAFTK